MKTKKRYHTKPLTAQQIDNIEMAVLELGERLIEKGYFVLQVKMEEENGRWYLRIYVDHADNTGCLNRQVTLEDCKEISYILEPEIENCVKQLQDFSYSLEISSPGLFRRLSGPRELRFYKGRRVEIKPKGEKAFIALLISYEDDSNRILYRNLSDKNDETQQVLWEPGKIEISLSPEIKTSKDIIEI